MNEHEWRSVAGGKVMALTGLDDRLVLDDSTQDDTNEHESNCMLVFNIFELLKNPALIEDKIEK